MLWKMLVGDVRRSKGVSITLTLLMTLASALVITGVSLVVQTMGRGGCAVEIGVATRCGSDVHR